MVKFKVKFNFRQYILGEEYFWLASILTLLQQEVLLTREIFSLKFSLGFLSLLGVLLLCYNRKSFHRNICA